jgi:hypothetical protein
LFAAKPPPIALRDAHMLRSQSARKPTTLPIEVDAVHPRHMRGMVLLIAIIAVAAVSPVALGQDEFHSGGQDRGSTRPGAGNGAGVDEFGRDAECLGTPRAEIDRMYGTHGIVVSPEQLGDGSADNIIFCGACGADKEICWFRDPSKVTRAGRPLIAQQPPEDTFVRHGREDRRPFALGGDQQGNTSGQLPSADAYAPYPRRSQSHPAAARLGPQKSRTAPTPTPTPFELAAHDSHAIGMVTDGAGPCVWWGKLAVAGGTLYACLGEHASEETVGGSINPVAGKSTQFHAVSGRFSLQGGRATYNITSLNGKPQNYERTMSLQRR